MNGKPTLIFSDTYTGPRWRYGLNYRPLAYAAVPAGLIIYSDRADPAYKFGTVDYPRELTEAEVAGYQLTAVGEIASRPDES